MTSLSPNLRKAGGTLAIGAALVLLGVLTLGAATFTLDETEQAVVLQFGKPVGDPVLEAGLHFKWPMIQEARIFDKRLQPWDGDPNQIPTRGREFISIDTTARWRIVDPLKFLESVRDETGAQSRLDDVLDSVVRDKISSTDLVEFVRSQDWDITEEDLRRNVALVENDEEVKLTQEIRIGREQLTREILAEASKVMPQYGISLQDLRIKRLNYVPSVQKRVFERMVSERQRIAEQFRSEGEGEASRIRGTTARQLAEITSEAKRKAEVVRGEADAEAARIYNGAFGEDVGFYTFWRTLQSYRQTLPGSTLVLDSGSPYLERLSAGGGQITAEASAKAGDEGAGGAEEAAADRGAEPGPGGKDAR